MPRFRFERATISESGYDSYNLELEEPIIEKPFKIIVEKHPDGFVAYPLGLKGVVVGESDTYEEVLADVKSAIKFHVETFGKEVVAPLSKELYSFDGRDRS